MAVQWWTYTEEGDRAMGLVMKDLLSQAKVGEWSSNDDWDTLTGIFKRFAATHPNRPSDDSGWDDTEPMEVVVWAMRAQADGRRIDMDL